MGILQNQYGSTRYRDFLQGLGSLIKLKEIDPQKVYTGGLAKDGDDGDFACIWQDDVMQVCYICDISNSNFNQFVHR
jgi:tuberous sclerosis protein 2